MTPLSIRLETSTLKAHHRSGVAEYTRLLLGALTAAPGIDLSTTSLGSLLSRIYTKLDSYGLAVPLDILLPKVDLTIFPNFSTYPTAKSTLTATVVHDLTYLYYPEATEEKNLHHLRRIVPRSIKKADFIITVSESIKAEIVKEFNIDPERCITTPIPPDPIFRKRASPEEIKSVKVQYGLDPNKKYIYFIGNLEPRKNLASLIKAYCALPDDIKNTYSLVLAGGKGWRTEATEAALKSAQDSGEDIHHIGFIDQKSGPALYQGASLFVMPSLYEGFGIPVLEAMSSGCPVVAADIPVLREVGAEAATYADTSDPDSFAATIVSALSAPVNKDLLLANVLRYSWEDNIDKIINTCRSLEP